MKSLEGTDQEHLMSDLRMAWENLPNGNVNTSEDGASVYLSVNDVDTREEALYRLAQQVTSDLAFEMVQLDSERQFPLNEARENSIEDITSRLHNLASTLAKDEILFSEDRMPKNHVAVDRILQRHE